MEKSGESLGKKIARLRGKTSQYAFAERADMSRRTLQNIEDGTTEDPGVLTVKNIAKALEVPIGDLVGEKLGPPLDLIARVVESGEAEDVLKVGALLLERFAAAPPKLRALVLAYLLQDFSVVRKYQSEIDALKPKPKAR